jgi:predicted metal-dependent phosphoesterase TrpH
MKADLHMHTIVSDGCSTPREMVDVAIKKGIDCICITDHSETRGAIEAMKYSYDKDILVLPGIEILCNFGDVIGINVKKNIPNGLSFEETIDKIHKQGGIATIPHPFGWPGIAGFWGSEKAILDSKIDCMEVFNASVIFSFCNHRAFNFISRNNIPFTAGSDAHRAEFIGRGYLETKENFSSGKELVEIILSKKAEAIGKHLNIIENTRNAVRGDASRFSVYYKRRLQWLAAKKVFEV